ncbi:MAG: response regulator [candidate division NC10 bacterium]|mgnify:CR=1 FL=1
MDAWRVLLAEDEALMAQMTVDMLAELPVEVSVARNGREALEQAQATRPDLILLDAMMPELNGFEVAAALKANPTTQDIPIIFLTARVRVEDKIRGLELGADDYLVKPVRREELLARVKNVLRRAGAHRATPPPETSLMRGRLETMSLPNIIQVLEVERRTGILRLTSGTRRGEILVTQGRVAYAMEGPRKGEAAVYRLLAWDEGEFALEPASGTGPAEAQVMKANQSLLMEGVRRLDEIPALRQALGPSEEPVKMFPVLREGLLRRTLPGGFRQVVELCDGTRTLLLVLEGSSLDDWGTLKILVRFLKLGMLEHGQAAKRGLPHLGVQIPVDFQSLRAFRGGQCFDLSARGIFLRTSEVFPVGEDLLLRFKLPGVAHPFRTAGRVVWSSPTDTPKGLPAGMGIQFLDLSEEERGTLERFIVELLLDRSQVEEAEG